MDRKAVSEILLTLLSVSIFTSALGAQGHASSVGVSEKGILTAQWINRFNWTSPNRMQFGCSPAIADLSGVNRVGADPDTDLEIVTGSDELEGPGPGYWHAFDSQGNQEWVVSTQSDQSRSSPVVIDLNGDGKPEIAGGTTSGHTVEVMDRFGKWFWTFPAPPKPGQNEWLSSPAVADLNAESPDDGPDVVILHRDGTVFCFDGDTSDNNDNGITLNQTGWGGREGLDWDVLWTTYIGGNWSWNQVGTPAIGDVDHDGQLEVVIGSADGNVYVLRGNDGTIECTFPTREGREFAASVALADLDGDGCMEIVAGSTNGEIYCFRWDGNIGNTQWIFSTGDAVYSSAAIGDLDGDGHLEVVVGSNDGNVYCLSANGFRKWSYRTGGAVYTSPALADRSAAGLYKKDWPMFRHDQMRTGYYGQAPPSGLDVYVGSDDHYLYLLKGDDGGLIDRFLTYGCIRSSPSVADVDGDRKLEASFYDWGNDSGAKADTFWCIEDATSMTHDVAIGMTLLKNVIGQTCNCSINVTLTNQGTFPETFNLTLAANQTIIAFFENISLTNGIPQATTRTFNIAGLPYGKYALNACVDPVPNETKTADNNCTGGCVTVTIPGDADGDFAVNLADLVLVAHVYNSNPRDSNWNPNVDIDGNLVVGLSDLVILAQHYGQHYP